MLRVVARPVAAVLAIVAAAAASSARAQDPRDQTFLAGERALGLGGAFTGLADDPSASFYNPAGLAHLPASTVAGSLSVNAFDHHRVDDGYGTPLGAADLDHEGTPSVPVFVGLVKKFGPRDEERVRRHAVALTTLRPVDRALRFSVRLEGLDDQARPLADALRIDHDDGSTWYGPSYAFRVTPRFALGVSLFLARRELVHREDQTVVTSGVRDPATGILSNATVFVRESLVRAETDHLVFRLGAQWIPSPSLHLGLMFQLPGIEIGDEGSIAERRVLADSIAAPPYATYFDVDESGLAASYPIPWELRLGAAYLPGDDVLVTGDVSLYGPVGSADDPIRTIGEPRADPVTGDVRGIL